jgi:hypothetical protein
VQVRLRGGGGGESECEQEMDRLLGSLGVGSGVRVKMGLKKVLYEYLNLILPV